MVVSPLYMYLQDVPLTYFLPRFSPHTHRSLRRSLRLRCACWMTTMRSLCVAGVVTKAQEALEQPDAPEYGPVE